MQLDFSGKKVLVTGATRGIGKAIADDFLEAGADVILTGTHADQIASLNRENESAGVANTRYAHLDLLDRASIDAFLGMIEQEGRVDVCVNNAGINRNNPFDEIRTEDWDALMEVNLRGPFLVSRTVGRLMKEANYGRIVNVASIWGVITRARRGAYATTKFGLVGMTKTLAVDLAQYNVLVNAVSPGFTLTELTRQTLPEEEREQLAAQIPLQRFAEPEEMAKVVLFLSSDLNTYITGQNIVADGGFVSV